jgi:hypothetical protein
MAPQILEPPPVVASAGEAGKGDYVCADCGYGIAAFRVLPECPMCHGTRWLAQPWSPFAGRRAHQA